MSEHLFFKYEFQIIWTGVVIVVLLLLKFVLKQSAKRIAKRDELNYARTRLIYKYINVLVFFIALFALDWDEINVRTLYHTIGLYLDDLGGHGDTT